MAVSLRSNRRGNKCFDSLLGVAIVQLEELRRFDLVQIKLVDLDFLLILSYRTDISHNANVPAG